MNAVKQGPPGGGRALSSYADVIALAVIALFLGFTHDSDKSRPFDRLLAPLTRVAAAASLNDGCCTSNAVGHRIVR